MALWSTVLYAADPLQERVTAARTLWDSLDLRNYQFVFQPEGGWISRPTRIVISDGLLKAISREVCSETFVGGASMGTRCKVSEQLAGPDDRGMTIPQVFDYVSSTISAARADPDTRDIPIEVLFDSRYGFPTHFRFDDPRWSDEITGFDITGFTILQ
jgi:hypothetical protein